MSEWRRGLSSEEGSGKGDGLAWMRSRREPASIGQTQKQRNIYYKKPSASHSDEEEEVNVTKTTADLPIISNLPAVSRTVTGNPQLEVPEAPVSDAPDTSDAEASEKCIRKPTKKISDLLGGRGSWSTAGKPKLAPRVQQPTDDWTASVSECDDEYTFVAETSNAEALEPWTLSEAQKRPDWSLWEKAIEEELASLRAAGTWEVFDAPQGVNIVGSKWVFRAKKDAAGNVICYKA